jgi:hypothetical protein
MERDCSNAQRYQRHFLESVAKRAAKTFIPTEYGFDLAHDSAGPVASASLKLNRAARTEKAFDPPAHYCRPFRSIVTDNLGILTVHAYQRREEVTLNRNRR